MGGVKESPLFDWKLDEMPRWKALSLKIYKNILTSENLCYWINIICYLPSLFVIVCISIPSLDMARDGELTIEEQWILVKEHEDLCNKQKMNESPPIDNHGKPFKSYCEREFDGITCWPSTEPGKYVTVPCPDYIADFDSSGHAQRYCENTGYWKMHLSSNQTWSNYEPCDAPKNQTHLTKIIIYGLPTTSSLVKLYNIGYSCSLVALILAMFILVYFKRLHCTRNYIHMHLFVSFILRAIIIFIKDLVLFEGSNLLDYAREASQRVLKTYETRTSISCKLVVTLFHYFLATNYFWVLVEGLYLHSLIFVTFFSDKKYLWRFILTGWGLPVFFVVPWAVIKSIKHDYGCWDVGVVQYNWIYNGPIIVANIINFMLFINIVRVLWYKMRQGMCGQPNISRQYRKLAKSTLVLIPMFGAHVIIFLGLPDSIPYKSTLWKVRMYWDLFFNSFQGFFVAIIYCFTNGEVQGEFKRAWDRFYTSFEIQRGQRERSRSSVTMLANVSSVSQVRNSIASQHNQRALTVELSNFKPNLTQQAAAGNIEKSSKRNGKSEYTNEKKTLKQAFKEKQMISSRYIRKAHTSTRFKNYSNITIPFINAPDAEEKTLESAMEDNIKDELKPLNSALCSSTGLEKQTVDEISIQLPSTEACSKSENQSENRVSSGDSGIDSLISPVQGTNESIYRNREDDKDEKIEVMIEDKEINL